MAAEDCLAGGCHSIVVNRVDKWGEHERSTFSLAIFGFISLGAALGDEIRLGEVLAVAVSIGEAVYIAQSLRVGAAEGVLDLAVMTAKLFSVESNHRRAVA